MPPSSFTSRPPKPPAERPPESMLAPEELSLASRIRLKIGETVDKPWFEKVQRAATYASVFGETIYRGTCGVIGMPADEQFADVLRLAPLTIFAANLGLKTTAKGFEHLKTPEAWIDAFSVAAEAAGGGNFGNLRLARLVKGIKGARQVAKFMRTTQVAMKEKSLEDKTMNEPVKTSLG